MTTPGNQEILDGLNMALEAITDSNPNFGTERFAANFTTLSADILLNEDELDYIRRKETVSVAVPENWHPLFCMTTDNAHDGVVPDILKEIEAYTGLHFSFLYAQSYMDAIRMVRDGRADILGFYLDSEEYAVEQGLAVTAAYASLNNIIVRNKASNYPDDELVGCAVEGREFPSNILTAENYEYSDIDEALTMVNRGEIDFVYSLANRIELEIQHGYYSNVVPVTLVNDISSVGFGLPRPADTMLLTILNKALNSLDTAQKEDLLNRNMVSIGANQVSIRSLISANPLLFAIALITVLLLIVGAVLLIAQARLRATRMQSNLEKAEAESRAKSAFLSRMSHEIRTPINAVVGLADLTSMMKDVPDEVRENLSKLRSSSRYLLSLINDILDMSRVENGMLTITSEPFSLSQVLDDLRSMMEAEAKRRQLTLIVEMKITHCSVTGDAVRLRQVLVNLLSNAFKFTPAGGKVWLRVLEEGSSEQDVTFTFQVIDNGIGIDPKDQERIFTSFELLGTNFSRSQGMGLGLAISSNIVRLMGGELQVKSRPDQGSEFYFTVSLPYGQIENEQGPTTAADGHFLDGIRILMAEDNDLNAEIAMELLQIQGAAVSRVENGKLAVERFRESRPGEYQIILMDVQMPVMNGLKATQAIRALPHPDASAIPIVAMTANTFQEDVDAAGEAGMTDFLAKPLDINKLYHTLKSLVATAPGIMPE